MNEAVTITVLAGITGSASGGMSIALAAMAETFIQNANGAGIPLEVLHRVASMSSGGLDTLPHNGAVITLLSVTGLTHRQAYGDIFVITLIKTTAAFIVIARKSGRVMVKIVLIVAGPIVWRRIEKSCVPTLIARIPLASGAVR